MVKHIIILFPGVRESLWVWAGKNVGRGVVVGAKEKEMQRRHAENPLIYFFAFFSTSISALWFEEGMDGWVEKLLFSLIGNRDLRWGFGWMDGFHTWAFFVYT